MKESHFQVGKSVADSSVGLKDINLGERLIREYAESYMEKIFYFCLKKTGNEYEAEDLTSDISLNILSALDNGTVPRHFPGWVWQIARNRYCAWAAYKSRQALSVTGASMTWWKRAD